MKLKYLQRTSDCPASESPPLLLVLHGKGGDESTLFSLPKTLDGRFGIRSLCAPHAIEGGGYRWYQRSDSEYGHLYDLNEIAISLAALKQAVTDAIAETGANPQRVFVFGFSQGASMALHLARCANPALMGVVAIAARLLPEPMEWDELEPADSQTKILLQHGLNDDTVGPSDQTEVTAAYATRISAANPSKPDAQLREYTCAHTVSLAMLRDAGRFLASSLNKY